MDGLFISSQLVSINGVVGGPTTQTFSVSVTTFPSELDFTIKGGNGGWVGFNTNRAKTPASIQITIDFSTFAPGEQRQTLVFFEEDVPGFDHPLFKKELRIIGTLTTGDPTPVPLASPLTLSFNDSSGGFEPLTQELEIVNSGDGQFS